jgi:general secretion pathway protein I
MSKPKTCSVRKNNLANAGFTLLETMIAMAIMAVAFASILMVEDGSKQTTMRAREMNIVSMLAKNTMIETEGLMEGHAFDDMKKEETGDFKAPFEIYKWKREVKEIEFPSFNMAATAGGDSKGGSSSSSQDEGTDSNTDQMTKLITQYLSKAVREVVVTISWKKGEGEQHYSVATYWVDLNHEFQVSQ